MNVNDKKIDELAKSFVNGNWHYVREKTKRLNKLEFFYLVEAIARATNRANLDVVNNIIGT